jgi:hypothetical protein
VDSNGAGAGTPPESTTYFYDLLGRPDYTIMPNGVVEDYTFDAMDRLDLMAHKKVSDNSVLASFDYSYRADGKRIGPAPRHDILHFCVRELGASSRTYPVLGFEEASSRDRYFDG